MDDDQFDNKEDVARAIAALSMANLKVTPNLISGIADTSGTSSAMSLAPSTLKANVTTTTTTTTSSIPSTLNITSGKRKLSPVRAPIASDNPSQVGIRAESPILLSSVEDLNESTFGGRAGVPSGPSTSRQPGPASPVNIISYDHILQELNGMITELHREKDDSLRVFTEKVAKLTTEKEMAREILNDEELRRSGQFCRKCYKSTKFQIHSITNCCSTVYYCSMECQHSHWEIHSIVCTRVRPNTADENN